MAAETHRIQVQTRGENQVLDLTKELAAVLGRATIRDGTATLFVIGSTAGLTTTEYEPGLVDHDLKACFEKIAPEDGRYVHEETWHDDNGHSHVRASLLGPSLTVPIVSGRATLGQWQQIVLIDFDTRPRTREIVVQLVGEGTAPKI
jgi:secondary thiamine-phosphate synthase enzyme